MNIKISPTPKQVVDMQLEAVMYEFDLQDQMEEALAETHQDEDHLEHIAYLERELASAKELHETPVNLGECKIVHQMALIRLTEEGLGEYNEYISADDRKANSFLLLGEVAQAPGHISVQSMSGVMYSMVHCSSFEIIPTQEC